MFKKRKQFGNGIRTHMSSDVRPSSVQGEKSLSQNEAVIIFCSNRTCTQHYAKNNHRRSLCEEHNPTLYSKKGDTILSDQSVIWK